MTVKLSAQFDNLKKALCKVWCLYIIKCDRTVYQTETEKSAQSLWRPSGLRGVWSHVVIMLGHLTLLQCQRGIKTGTLLIDNLWTVCVSENRKGKKEWAGWFMEELFLCHTFHSIHEIRSWVHSHPWLWQEGLVPDRGNTLSNRFVL